MKKVSIVLAAAAAFCGICGCQKNQVGTEEGILNLGFAEPSEISRTIDATKSASVPDTNSFILSITDGKGNTVYKGEYGAKPSELTLTAGTYSIDVVSDESRTPAFDNPIYGDHQVVVVTGGMTADVLLMCRLENSGIQLIFTDAFRKKYGSGDIVLEQEAGSLKYAFNENRTGYFLPGNIAFTYTGESGGSLFNKVVNAGELYRLTLNASSSEADAGFSISIDDSATEIDETITVGDESWKLADGSTKERALDITSAAQREGDTVWVWGYIIGGDLTSTGISFDAPFEKSSNLAIAKSPGDRSRDKCLSVELSKANVKEALNLVSHPENLGRKVWLYGIVSNYFSMPGIKRVTDFEIDGK